MLLQASQLWKSSPKNTSSYDSNPVPASLPPSGADDQPNSHFHRPSSHTPHHPPSSFICKPSPRRFSHDSADGLFPYNEPPVNFVRDRNCSANRFSAEAPKCEGISRIAELEGELAATITAAMVHQDGLNSKVAQLEAALEVAVGKQKAQQLKISSNSAYQSRGAPCVPINMPVPTPNKPKRKRDRKGRVGGRSDEGPKERAKRRCEVEKRRGAQISATVQAINVELQTNANAPSGLGRQEVLDEAFRRMIELRKHNAVLNQILAQGHVGQLTAL